MDLKRFFTDRPIGEYAYLTGQEFFHAVKVVRLKVGYKLIVCRGDEYDYYCTVEEIGKDQLMTKVDKKVSNDTELSRNVTLYIGVNKDLDTVVQKAVELGVNRIVPFTSQHSNVSKINKERLDAIVMESSKQCGRSKLATIGDLISFSEINTENMQVFAFYEFERNNKVSAAPLNEKDIAVVIGSEGGFSIDEYKTMLNKGWHVLTLGKRILRVGTAVVSALTLVNERAGEL